MGTVKMKCIVCSVKIICLKWFLAIFLIVSAFVHGTSGNGLEGCMDKCYRDSCRGYKDEKLGCFGKFTCYNGCKIRDLGLSRRECQDVCANPGLYEYETRLSDVVKVKDYYFTLHKYDPWHCRKRYDDKYCSFSPTYG